MQIGLRWRSLRRKPTLHFEEAAEAMRDPQRAMSDTSTKMSPEHIEPSAESLEEMPPIDPSTHRRRPGRGHHAHLRGGELVAVDPDLWPYFRSSEAVNAALRSLVEAAKHIHRTGS